MRVVEVRLIKYPDSAPLAQLVYNTPPLRTELNKSEVGALINDLKTTYGRMDDAVKRVKIPKGSAVEVSDDGAIWYERLYECAGSNTRLRRAHKALAGGWYKHVRILEPADYTYVPRSSWPPRLPEGLCFYLIDIDGSQVHIRTKADADRVDWDNIHAYRVSGKVMDGYVL